jgi:geranylgeranyl diphosphate synthase type I
VITGKPVHSDLRARKKSLPVTYATTLDERNAELTDWLRGSGEPAPAALARVADLLDHLGARHWALAQARRRMELAEEALSTVDIKPEARSELLELARYVVERDA